MSSAKSGSGGDSGGTSSSRPPGPANERSYLDEQAAQAKDALSRTGKELALAAMGAADVRAWAKQHPWITMGSAAVAGFAVAAVLTPSSAQTFRQKWDELAQGVRKMMEDEEAEEIDISEVLRGRKKGRGGSWKSSLGKQIAGLLKTAVGGAVSAAIAARKDDPSDGSSSVNDPS